MLDALRDFRQEESFLIGLRLLTADLTPRERGEAYSALAAAIVRAMLAHVASDFETRFGKVPGGRCVILGMGKLGSREMTAASDLDLIVIYDFDPAHPDSDGADGVARDPLLYAAFATPHLRSHGRNAARQALRC